MKVAYNLFDQVPGEGLSSGVYLYCKGMLGAMSKVRPDVEQVLFVNELNRRDFEGICPSATFETVPLDPRNRLARVYWEQALYPVRLRRHAPDLVHSVQYTAPLACMRRNVVTIHDGVHFFYARNFPQAMSAAAIYYLSFEALFARGYRCVLADSEFTKSEIERHMHVPGNRVRAVPLAPYNIPEGLRQRDSGSGTRLLLTVASSALHKNTIQVVRALGDLVNKYGVDARLVVVGSLRAKRDPRCVSIEDVERAAAAADVSERCTVAGFLPETELRQLMANADLLVFPTLYEGFGVPVVEAMAGGIPVACSSIPTLHEICGDAVAYFDPNSPAEIAHRLALVLADPGELARLSNAGRERAAGYSWERCAMETVAAYEDCMGSL